MLNRKHLFMKIILIVIAEAIALSLTYGFSYYIHPIKYAMITHIIGGAVLAVLVVSLYNRRLKRKTRRVKKEIKDLTNTMYRKIPENMDDTDTKGK
jgi:uncharacterized integral membrane protein